MKIFDVAQVVDVLVSIVLVYLVFSLMLSAVLERYNKILRSRSAVLVQALEAMLDKDNNAVIFRTFIKHHLITSLGIEGKRLKAKFNKSKRIDLSLFPQYIPSSIFSKAFIDSIYTTYQTDSTESFRDVLEKMPNSDLKNTLIALYRPIEGCEDRNEKLEKAVEDWFNKVMDRTTGWYKDRQYWPSVIFGVIIAFAFNLDAVHLIRVISKDEKLRANLITVAEHASSKNEVSISTIQEGLAKLKAPSKHISSKMDSLDVNQNVLRGLISDLNLPFLWNKHSAPASWYFDPINDSRTSVTFLTTLDDYVKQRNHSPTKTDYLLYFLGILSSGWIISLGAPILFDLLIKLVNIRRAGIKPTS